MEKKLQNTVTKKPEKCITVEEARELHGNWCNHRGKHLEECLGHQDNREFWWSVAELEEYLEYVKAESKEQGITDPGIRIYLGAYSKETCKMGKGYSTLFMTPTGSPAKSLGKDGYGAQNNYNIAPFNRGGSGGDGSSGSGGGGGNASSDY